MTPDFVDEESKTGLGFEIRQPQQNCQCMPTLQSMANLAVVWQLKSALAEISWIY